MDNIQMNAAHADIDNVFGIILPQHGMDKREGQIMLCHNMLDALAVKKIALYDAGVGIGKTTAYLIAALMLHKHWPKDKNIAQYYGQDNSVNLPFLVSTSSIALQHAILEEYIPFLSDVLTQHSIIMEPFTGQIQKGKENYVCRERLEIIIRSPKAQYIRPERLEAFRALMHEKDFDHVRDLGPFDRAKVCVPRHCVNDCVKAPLCLYKRYIRSTKANPALFQICNHNYYLADAIHRDKGYAPLLPYYRAVIVDEAHQLYASVQSMCGSEASKEKIGSLLIGLRAARMNTEANRLSNALDTLFAVFHWQAKQDELYRKSGESRQALKCVLRHLQDIQLKTAVSREHARLHAQAQHLTSTIEAFYTQDARCLCFIEWDDRGNPCLKTVEKNYRFRLNRMLWNKPMGSVLTSGTLAAGRDMAFFKERMGLTQSDKTTETIISSPFDYKNNCLLYLSPDMPACNNNAEFRAAAAKRIAELIIKTAGHTLVLCTSYTEMKEIFQQVNAMDLSYPLFAMPRRGKQYLEEFRASGNGVLFAAGACWEGMDFPGDLVSSLIIVRLPFPRRDALHEGEKERYMAVRDFIRAVAIPEMQMKLRQGFGRGMRLMTDTCVVSILDGRAAPGRAHHEAVINALPELTVTRELEDVAEFIRRKKGKSYFEEGTVNV